MRILDCKGLACPKPVIMTKKELEAMESGEIEVIVDNEAARENVSKFASSQGYEYTVSEKEGLHHVIINKKSKSEGCPIMTFEEDRNLVLFIGTDKLGLGDDKLGAALMKSYMYALTENDIKPKTMIFVNGGVRLTTEGSDVIESIKTLHNSGVEVISCGTCLDFYGLKDKLLVGEVSNMYTIVEKMNSASNTIKL